MDYEYEASGGITIWGCTHYELSVYWYYDFAIGSTVYSKPKAQRGIYEKIVIKNVRLPKSYEDLIKTRLCKFCNLSPLYVDTFNALWNEEDLVSYSDATELIDDYIIRRNGWAEEASKKCLA